MYWLWVTIGAFTVIQHPAAAAAEAPDFARDVRPILVDLKTSKDVTPEQHRLQVEAVNQLNRLHRESTGDPAIDAQIASYELAFRMQSAAPELVDLSGETKQTLEAYGRSEFARSLLLAVDGRVHRNDFHATLLHLFGLGRKRLKYRHHGADVRLTDVAGNVVKELLS